MKIVRCPVGHYYDSSKYENCPVCNPSLQEDIDRLSEAMALYTQSHPDVSDGSSLPLFSGAEEASAAPLGPTMPADDPTKPAETSQADYSVPVSGASSENSWPAERVKNDSPVRPIKTEVYSAQPLPSAPSSAPKGIGKTLQYFDELEPPAGWLVCIEGPDKGKDFRFGDGQSAVGRSSEKAHYRIPLSDHSISRAGEAANIVYDSVNCAYYITPGGGQANLVVYCNRKPVLSSTQIRLYDHIRVGKDIFLFIPFCSDAFKWDYAQLKAEAIEKQEKTVASGTTEESPASRKLIMCPKGHYYNALLHSRCPICFPDQQQDDSIFSSMESAENKPPAPKNQQPNEHTTGVENHSKPIFK